MLKVQDDKWVGYSMLDGWDENYSDLALPNQWVNSSWKLTTIAILKRVSN